MKELETRNAEELKEQKIKEQQVIAAKEAEIAARQREIELEKQRREKIAQSIENATNLEMQADQMFTLKRYTESIAKYNESKKIFEELKSAGDFDDQTNKIGYLYEEQGDDEYKKKNWQESQKKYQLAADNMKLTNESNEIQKRVEKKLKKATSKAGKKWWQFWK